MKGPNKLAGWTNCFVFYAKKNRDGMDTFSAYYTKSNGQGEKSLKNK